MGKTRIDAIPRGRRSAVAAAIAAAAAACLAAATVACSSGKAAPPVPVASSPAVTGRIGRSIALSGVLAPAESVTIYPRAAGTMREVAVDVGSRVVPGQVLARLDAKELAAQLEVAQAAVAIAKDKAAQAELEVRGAQLGLGQAQKEYDRDATLFASKVVTESQLDEAKERLDLARNQFESAQRQLEAARGSGLRQAEAQAKLIQIQLQDAQIESPIAGTVTSRSISAGEVCSPGSALMTIADTADLRFRGTIPQDDVIPLRGGERATVTVGGLGGAYEARVVRAGPIAAASGQYFPIELRVANDGRLLIGMTAKATIVLESKEGVVVPLSAVLRRESEDFAFVIQDGHAHLRKLRLGSRDSSRVIVLSGLAPGESVATGGLAALKDDVEVAR